MNEYADDAEYGKDGYTCYVCRDKMPEVLNEGGVVVGVDPGTEPGVVAYGYWDRVFDPKGVSGWKAVADASPMFFGVDRDEPPVRLERTCAPWQPDAAAVAAKEKEILDLAVRGNFSEMQNRLPELRRQHAELLVDPTLRLEIEDLLKELEDSARAAQEAIDKVPDVLRYAYQTRFYSATESK